MVTAGLQCWNVHYHAMHDGHCWFALLECHTTGEDPITVLGLVAIVMCSIMLSVSGSPYCRTAYWDLLLCEIKFISPLDL